MATLNYSKKQIQPLIDKYAINAETNTTFARIIMMFDGQPNYQLWGVKVVFSKAIKVEELEAIKHWAEENPSLIKHLSKNGNLICYSTAADFATLRGEIDGLSKIAMVKNTISMFNTDQRKILSEAILKKEFNGLNCLQDKTFKQWCDLFAKFNRLSGATKSKVIGRMSAVRNVSEINSLLNQALKEKYSWNKEDLLSYVFNNTPNCEVVFDNDNVVILQVKSYEDSNSLCYGRTSWCITSSDSQWKNYVTNKSNKQYFFFDFSKAEKDELAHIGFTIDNKIGFYAAHSTSDSSLMNEGITYHGKRVNIQKALSAAGVNLGVFLKLKTNGNFKWNYDEFMKFVKKNSANMAIAYDKNGRVIVNALTPEGVSKLCSHTFIKHSNYAVNNDSKCYVLLDFNLTENDDKCIVFVYYKKDKYKIDTLSNMFDAYGTNIMDDKYLASVGINSDDYINREKIDPSIMLHKLIDEGDEDGAIKLIENHKDINVNYEFNDNRPIFKAIEAKLHRVIGKIIANDKFDCNVDDGFGESLIQNLLFTFYLDETNKTKKEKEKNVQEMIEVIIDSNKFDLNFVDDNEDTAINIACTNPNMLWLVKKLAAKPNVNINCENDIHYAAFGNAMRYRNYEAMRIIGSRPDLVVLDSERELAKKLNINIDDYIKPTPFAETTEETVVTAEVENADKYNEIFKKVFAS